MKILLMISVLSTVAFGQSDPLEKQQYLYIEAEVAVSRPAKLLCTVPTAKSPAVRGKIRLGMSRAEYENALKPKVVLLDVGGVGPRAMEGVSLAPTFLADKLIRVRVAYTDGVTWDADAEFAYVVATEFGLPPEAWRSNGSRGLVMFCDGWLMIARENWIELRDESGMAASKAAAEKSAKQAIGDKKKTFKP